MRTMKLLAVMVVLGRFSTALQAEEAYHVVKVWPEAPLGWHFYQPQGIAVDKSGNVYVGDSGNYRVKKFDSEGRFITQWGSPGQGDGQFNTIYNIRVGGSGIVYVSDYGKLNNNRILKFTPYGQFIGLFERNAPGANKSRLSVDVAEDDKGNVFVLAVDFVLEELLIRRATIEKYSPHGEFIAQWVMDAGSGDGQLQLPEEIGVDAKGNIYIADTGNYRLQRFDSSGKFNAKWGDTSLFDLPRSITFDKAGDVYVLDFASIQKFTPEGQFLAKWPVTGQGHRRFAVDVHSNIYVTNESSHEVLRLDASGNVTSRWGSAGTGDDRFAEPSSIVIDPSGDVVVADDDNSRIQRFTSEGKFISTWGKKCWYAFGGFAADVSGNLYVGVKGTDEVQKFNSDGKLVSRWGSSGSGDGQFHDPWAIAVGPFGDVYVADAGNGRVQKFTSDGRFLAKWGTGESGDGQFDFPSFIAVDGSGNVWVGDQFNPGKHRMQRFDANGKFLTKSTKRVMLNHWLLNTPAVAVDLSGNSYYAFENKIDKYDPKGELISTYRVGDSEGDRLAAVKGMYADASGCLYIADSKDSIRKYDADGNMASKWTAADTEGKVSFPAGPIAVDEAGNVYVAPDAGRTIRKLSPDGKLVAESQIEPPAREGRFVWLGGVTVDSSGKVYAVESGDDDWHYGTASIQEFDANGQFITRWDLPKTAEGKIKYPALIAMDGSGNAYVTDKSSHCVHKLDAQGKYIKSWGSKGTGDSQFDTPEGIAVDGSGHVYICDRQNSRIQEFDSDGNFLAKWGKEGSGDGEFHFPAAVAVDQEGNVFVADSDNHRVQKFTVEGKFLTKWGEFGEAPGQFNVPLGIAVDKQGNVYVSDSHNHRIQKFAPVASH
jgi:tripartite motif-containing protein 71